MFNILRLFPFVLALFLAIWLIRPLPWLAVWRWLASLFLMLCAAKMLIIPLHGRYMNDLSSPVMIVSSWGFSLVIIAGVLGFIWAVCGLLGKYWWPVLWQPMPRFLLIAGVSVILTTWGIWQGVKVPDVREHQIVIPHLPAGLEGTRIAVLSDLHIGLINKEPWVRAVVERTNAAKANLIAVLGDAVDGSTTNLAPDVAPLGELTAPLGVFFVTGNHEYYSGFEPWMQHFKDLGLRVLANEHDVLSIGADGKDTLVVAGILDPAGRRYAENTRPDIAKALQGRPQGVDTLTLLLAHQPLHTTKYAEHGVDIQISGHTHGGTVLPLQSFIASLNSGFVLGQYLVDKTRLFVTSGSGIWSGVPLRLGVPAEIAVLTLTAGK